MPNYRSFYWPPGIHRQKFVHPFFPSKHTYFKYPSAIVRVCRLSRFVAFVEWKKFIEWLNRPTHYHNGKESTERKLVKFFMAHAGEMLYGKMGELHKLLKGSD